MEDVLDKNKIIESEAEINLILERQKEAQDGKVMSFDDSIKEFIKRRIH